MPDAYIGIENAPRDIQALLADAMEERAVDPELARLRRPTLESLATSADARLLDIGCGPGSVSAELLIATGAASVVGVDPSPVMVERSQSHWSSNGKLSFVEGSGYALPFPDASFDGILCHTVLCHLPDPVRVLREARRVLRRGGRLAIFDGDYAANTVAIGPLDPLQLLLENAVHHLVHNPYFCRTLTSLLREAGFTEISCEPRPYVADREPITCLSLIDRGAFFLVRDGLMSAALAEEMKREARRRADAGAFYGSILFYSACAKKGDEPS